MPQRKHFQGNWARGEWSKAFWFREDLKDFSFAARSIKNMIPTAEGLTSRRGTLHLGETKHSADSTDKKSRLFDFAFSNSDAMQIEMGDLYCRFWQNEALAGAPFVLTSPYTEAELRAVIHRQGGDTVFLAHENHHPRTLIRTSAASWAYAYVDLTNGPWFELHAKTITLSLSDNSPGTRTVTADKDIFTDSMKTGNALFLLSGGYMKITNVISGTQATATVFQLFPESKAASADWLGPYTAQGATGVNITVAFVGGGGTASETVQLTGTGLFTQASNPVGRIIDIDQGGTTKTRYVLITGRTSDDVATGIVLNTTVAEITYTNSEFYDSQDTSAAQFSITPTGTTGSITLQATGAVFNALHAPSNVAENPESDEPGSYFKLNGGLVKITAFTDSSTVDATVINELSSVSATVTWLESAWSRYRGYPKAVSFFGARLWWGGSSGKASTLFGSQTAAFQNYDIGTGLDTDAIEYDVAGERRETIEMLTPADNLLIGTSGGVHIATASNNGPLLPTDITIRQKASIGIKNIRPIQAGTNGILIDGLGRKVWELVSQSAGGEWKPSDLTLAVPDLFLGAEIVEIAYEKEPNGIIWFLLDTGTLLAFVYRPDIGIAAWSHMSFGGNGIVESVSSIPYQNEHKTWLIVKRTINGATKRYVEVLDSNCVLDSCILYAAGPYTSLTGLSHLEGETVGALADGRISTLSSAVVVSGAVALSSPDTADTTAQAGLAFDYELQTLHASVEDALGISAGRQQKILEVTAFLSASRGGKLVVGDKEYRFVQDLAGEESDIPIPVKTGFVRIAPVGIIAKDDMPIATISEDRPLKLTLTGLSQLVEISND